MATRGGKRRGRGEVGGLRARSHLRACERSGLGKVGDLSDSVSWVILAASASGLQEWPQTGFFFVIFFFTEFSFSTSDGHKSKK